ncbi:MAG: flagellar filament capping protein FliD [Lachnospiraceae bacterium]|nr:flagellar filament capping protein FliD [Lachnospiraceae bacterium]
MPVRLSGMNSGLDTEAIVAELVKAKSTKKENLEKDQKKLSWKQDAWKELNTKIYGLYSKTLSDMRFSTAYLKKTTKSSNSAVSVVTGANAPETQQSLKITSMAKAGYLTGEELKVYDAVQDKYNKASYTSSTTMDSIEGMDFSSVDTKTITVKINGSDEAVDIELTAGKKISDVINELNAAGVKANFDEKNQRFYIAASGMGADKDFKITGDPSSLRALGLDYDNLAEPQGKKIGGSNAQIVLNGQTYTSDTNTFEINDLTITINNMTSDDITLTTTQDTDGIYENIKKFLKEYNELIKEMDKLYNAESASKYKMLSDDEKEAMNEDDVKEWEDKIKSALLRKDSTLGGVASAMKEIMLSGVTLESGKKMYLSDFGIGTLSYFSAPDNEKSTYHIDGDKDDESTSGNVDKLKAMIASNPEEVTEFFTGLCKNLYNKLDKLMASTDYSSAFTIYNDKSLKTEYEGYKDKISKQEEKINTWEDFYYKKFTRMETAMAKLQSQESAISGLFNS